MKNHVNFVHLNILIYFQPFSKRELQAHFTRVYNAVYAAMPASVPKPTILIRAIPREDDNNNSKFISVCQLRYQDVVVNDPNITILVKYILPGEHTGVQPTFRKKGMPEVRYHPNWIEASVKREGKTRTAPPLGSFAPLVPPNWAPPAYKTSAKSFVQRLKSSFGPAKKGHNKREPAKMEPAKREPAKRESARSGVPIYIPDNMHKARVLRGIKQHPLKPAGIREHPLKTAKRVDEEKRYGYSKVGKLTKLRL